MSTGKPAAPSRDPSAGSGAPLTGITSMAMRHVLDELLAAWQRASGRPVALTAVGGVDAARRVERGEAFDFVVLAADAIDRLAAAARVDARSIVPLACSAIAIAVPAGAPVVDVSTEEAVRQALREADRIGYSTGPSGAHLLALVEAWGLRDELAPRLVQAAPGVPVAGLVARGDVDLGLQQTSELVHAPGVAIAGLLPETIQRVTVFAGAVCTDSTSPVAARELLIALAAAEGDAARRRHGLEPPPR